MERQGWRIHGIALLLVGGLLATLAWAETTEIVTYYPIPNTNKSDLDRLHAGRATVGAPYSITEPPSKDDPASSAWGLANGMTLISGQLGIGSFSASNPTDSNVPLDILQTSGNYDPIVFQARGSEAGSPGIQLFAGVVKDPSGATESKTFMKFVNRNPSISRNPAVSVGMSNPGVAGLTEDLIFATTADDVAGGFWTERMRIVDDTDYSVKVSGGLFITPETFDEDVPPPTPFDPSNAGIVKYFQSTTNTATNGLYLYGDDGKWHKIFASANISLDEKSFSGTDSYTLINAWQTVSANSVDLEITSETPVRGLYQIEWSGDMHIKNLPGYWAKYQIVFGATSSHPIAIYTSDKIDDADPDGTPDPDDPSTTIVHFSGSTLLSLNVINTNYHIRMRAYKSNTSAAKIDASIYNGDIKAAAVIPM